MASNVRQSLHEDSEAGINKQINLELYVMYTYLSMASYYDRHNVALPGMASFFKKAAMEELRHAQKFMEYQNKRGGTVVLNDIQSPAKEEWGSALDGMKAAQELECTVNQALLDLHTISKSHLETMKDLRPLPVREQLDRLNPAYLEAFTSIADQTITVPPADTPTPATTPPATAASRAPANTTNPIPRVTRTKRFGRKGHWPKRLNL